jgi:hypothetical protein
MQITRLVVKTIVALSLTTFGCGAADRTDVTASTLAASAKIQLNFGRDLEQPINPNGTVRAGAAVHVTYERQRFFEIIGNSVEDGQYWAEKYHCYGYGCCDVQFPQVTVYYRSFDKGPFTGAKLQGNAADFKLDPKATRLELYVQSDRYDLKAWYCGCDSVCAEANRKMATSMPTNYTAYDSHFRDNYIFPVQK